MGRHSDIDGKLVRQRPTGATSTGLIVDENPGAFANSGFYETNAAAADHSGTVSDDEEEPDLVAEIVAGFVEHRLLDLREGRGPAPVPADDVSEEALYDRSPVGRPRVLDRDRQLPIHRNS